MPDPWDDPAQLAALMQRPDMRARLANAALGMPAGDPNALLAASMTHWPEAPNPAAPYIQGAKRIAGDISEFIPGIGGGLQGLANREQIDTPQWSQAIGRALHNDAADTAIGMATPLGSLPQRIAALEQSLGRKLRPDLSLEQVEKLEQAGSAGNKSSRYKSLATIQARKAIGEDIYPGAPKQVEEPPPSITAYHGSPHDFDKFDLSRIGTGEGAQAYGHGLYFAENEGVAKNYRDQLAPPPNLTSVQDLADQYLTATGNRNEAIKELQKAAKTSAGTDYGRDHDEAIKLLKSGWTSPTQSPGRMYQVSINADPEHFLDWDKPLSEQPKNIQEIVSKLGGRKGSALANSGDWWLGEIAGRHGGTHEEATKALRAAGIPGIKYLDQGSRFTQHQSLQQEIDGYERELQSLNSPDWPRPPGGVPPGHAERVSEALAEAKASLAKLGPESSTRNFVVFDDKLIDIMKKYGLAGLSALPAAGMYHFQQGGNQGAQ